MKKIYSEYKQLNLPDVNKEILAYWKKENVFQQSIETRKGNPSFTFYEGPPSANGMPGIHHVMARAIKDIFCRYKTLQGYQVNRKAGWDTHGLPVELQVEKELGITKDDIGTKISIEDYNKECRKAVMKYTDVWNRLTEEMGYWVDMQNPYITYENRYIETVWWLLSEFHRKGLLYKGYTIQPYSPAAGTGLSTHELNQPGCYKQVKDTTVVAQFKIKDNNGVNLPESTYMLAWTTTPWTLPSNTALAVGKEIEYVLIATVNPYTGSQIHVILAKDLMGKYFQTENENGSFDDFKPGDKKIPYRVLHTLRGNQLAGFRYEQLLPYAQPSDGDAFKVIIGDFVSTEDGTGIVHIAPSFGSDDFRVARQNGIGSLTLVDRRGRFTDEVTDFAGEYVKEQYLSTKELEEEKNKQGKDKYLSVDERIAIKLKQENKAFKVEKYEHSYPHCWRTDKPVLYYPLDSWFIKTTAIKSRLIELNESIQWKPESTGTGRFANWLENLVDWNLSRSRYWGIPLPIWRTEDGTEEVCIHSVKELSEKIDKAVAKGLMKNNPYALMNGDPDYDSIDLHRPYVDDIILVSSNGKAMYREKDLIDVWFDSGAMPYAQQHYPFENKDQIDGKLAFPADFIAEGVDQTRGWFFTLHVIAAGIFDSVAYKTVISNGLVLDKHGQKMSKRLGNAVDPFETMNKYGSDALRWYMISNAQPWDNLKFDSEGIVEVQRKYFGTLFNTYNFYALYANVDEFVYDTKHIIPVQQRPEFDRWILSRLNAVVQEVTEELDNYEPTRATRIIQDFVCDDLSNWYIRLSRRRFWKGELNDDKRSAYQTLYECLRNISIMMSPVAPFFAEKIYQDLNPGKNESVHLQAFPKYDKSIADYELNESMKLAQLFSSMVLSLRKKQNIRVRQPLQKILIPTDQAEVKERIHRISDLIKSETNVREIEFISMQSDFIKKKAKADFKKLGPKYGKLMKEVAQWVSEMNQQNISELETAGFLKATIKGEQIKLDKGDVEIISEDIPGWLVTSSNDFTVALDITLTEELINEGIARDLINRLQNIRKDRNYELTDRIVVKMKSMDGISSAVKQNLLYICTEVLADSFEVVDHFENDQGVEIELENELKTWVQVSRK
jgi:isoleucyl-tRNA synthetase